MVLLPIDRTVPKQCSNQQACTKERLPDESQQRAFQDPSALAEVESERPARRSRFRMNASIELLRETMARTHAAIARRSSLHVQRGPARGANAREPPG